MNWKIDQKKLSRMNPRDKSMRNTKGRVREMNDTVKRSNMYLIGIPKRRESETEVIFKEIFSRTD